jgi:cell division septum initiation protein DivIVA
MPVSFRGYNKESVDRLLSSASNQLEAQLVEIRRLSSLLKNAESDLERFRAQESTLNSALVLAQRASDETRSLAHKEADLIIEAARQEAKEIKRQAQDSVRALKWEAERLEDEQRSFVARFRGLLNEHMCRLNDEQPAHAVLKVEEAEEATG